MEAAVNSVHVRGGQRLHMVTDAYWTCGNRLGDMKKILEAVSSLCVWRRPGTEEKQDRSRKYPHFFDVQHAVIEAEKEFESNQGVSLEYESLERTGETAVFTLKPFQDKIAEKALEAQPAMVLTDSQGQEVFGKVRSWEPDANRLTLQLWTSAEALPDTGVLHKRIAMFYNGVENVLQSNQEGTAYDFFVGELSEELEKQCREGNVLQFAKTDGKHQMATVEEYHREAGKLRLLVHSVDQNLIPVQGVLRKTVNVSYKSQQQALKRIENESGENPALRSVLMGKSLPPIEIRESYAPEPGVTINKRQQEAVEKAINTQDLLLIQGPPGSGKTTIIVEMVRHFVKNGQRVLICSQSNHAVDNVLAKCLDLWYDPEKTQHVQCLRIGNSNKVEPAVRGNLRRPLTQKIQDDMSLRSRAAYKTHLAQSQEKKQSLQTRQQQLLQITELLIWAEDTVNILTKAYFKVRNSLLSPLFGGRDHHTLEKSLPVWKKTAIQIHTCLRQLLTAQTVDPQAHVPSMIEALNTLMQAVRWMETVAQAHPIRSKFFLNKTLGCLRSQISDHHQWLGQRIAALWEYTGNPLAQELPLQPDTAGMYGAQLYQYRRWLDDYVRAIDRNNAQLAQTLENWQEVLASDNKTLGEAMLKSVRIVGGTCIGISTKAEFREMHYDVAIVDEAGQIAMHDLLVPLVKARKMILIGDHVQLPPMENNEFAKYYTAKHYLADKEKILEEKKDDKSIPFFYPFSSVHEIFSKSLFEVLIRNPVYKSHTVALDTQYRMHKDIAAYISKNFYGGNYKSIRPDSDFATGLKCFPGPVWFADTCALPDKGERQDSNESYYNLREAEICAGYLVQILTQAQADPQVQKAISDKTGKPDIGVITAYGAQISRIRQALNRQLAARFSPDLREYLSGCIAINTLDSFQGMENKIILYSFVRSNRTQGEDGKTVYSIGFMNDVRRLNVLMTRAKSLLIMVGDSETLTRTTARTKHDKTPAAQYYARLIKHCMDKNGYQKIEKEG